MTELYDGADGWLDDPLVVDDYGDDPYAEIESEPALDDMPPLPDVGADDLPNFDGANGTPVAGDPLIDMQVWHEQETSSTCAVASQEFVLEQLTGEQFDESKLAAEAEANGWYQPGGGTPMADMDKLLETHGVPTETHENGTLDDLTAQLDAGNKLIVSVDASEIWEAGQDPTADDALDVPAPGMGADHAVQVAGIVDTPNGQMVVLNDPGSPDGQGTMVPADEFTNAWADSGSFYVAAGPAADDSIDALGGGSLSASMVGTSTSYGNTTSGDPVSYSHTDGTYYNDKTWDEVKPVSSTSGT